MKKLLCIIMFALMLTTGCTAMNIGKLFEKKVPKADITQLQSNEGLMFSAGSTNRCMIDQDADMILSRTYQVNWDGTVTRRVNYSVSGCITDEAVLSDEDYMKIYEFAEYARLNDPYKDHEEYACDGDTWGFTYYYSPSEDPFIIYSGYCYQLEEANEIKEILSSYFGRVDYYAGPDSSPENGT